MVIKENGDKLLIPLYIQPRASHDKIVGLYNASAIKITITAPPVEGQANKYLLRYLSKMLNLPKQQMSIHKGEQSRYKTLIITAPYSKEQLTKVLLLNSQLENDHVK